MLAGDIDFDRLVWDQAYRHDVMDLLRTEPGAYGATPPEADRGRPVLSDRVPAAAPLVRAAR